MPPPRDTNARDQEGASLSRGASDAPDAQRSAPPQAPAEVRLGSVLVSLLDPEPGQAVEFNRWYERDHFYSGCLVGPHFFAGRRFVATRTLKDERMPEQTAVFRDVRDGSYLSLYWLLAGHETDAEGWSVERVHQLIEHGRMQPGPRPVHAGFYQHRFEVAAAPAGIPAELALDHPFGGVGFTLLQAPTDESRDELLEALSQRILPETLAASEAALCLGLTPRPLPEQVPSYVERPECLGRRVLLLSFFPNAPFGAMRDWTEQLVERLRAEGLGRLEVAAPFIPTVPGTDRYVDEL